MNGARATSNGLAFDGGNKAEMHYESRKRPIYALVIAKSGSTLKE